MHVFASVSTIIAAFENVIAFAMDPTGCSRRQAVNFNMAAILVQSMPCMLGYNVLSGFIPFGAGSAVLALEDFIVSNNRIPVVYRNGKPLLSAVWLYKSLNARI